MKKDFESLYEEIEKINSAQLKDIWDKAQKEKRKSNIIFLIIIIVTVIACLISMNLNNKYTLFHMLFIISFVDIFAYIIINIIFSKNSNEYNTVFKDNVIEKILKNFYDELDYIPKKQMPQNIYNEGRYNEYYNRYYSDDYCEGKVDKKYEFKMAEVKTVEEETKRDSDGDTETTRTTKFHGIFAKIKIGKSIRNDLTIKQNGLLGKKNKLEMDSQEFEKYFDVTSSDKIIGMQLLTHDIMDLLVQFRKSMKMPYDIAIYEDTMYLRIHSGEMFEGKINKDSILDKKSTEKYYQILDFITTLAKELIKVVEQTEI